MNNQVRCRRGSMTINVNPMSINKIYDEGDGQRSEIEWVYLSITVYFAFCHNPKEEKNYPDFLQNPETFRIFPKENFSSHANITRKHGGRIHDYTDQNSEILKWTLIKL